MKDEVWRELCCGGHLLKDAVTGIVARVGEGESDVVRAGRQVDVLIFSNDVVRGECVLTIDVHDQLVGAILHHPIEVEQGRADDAEAGVARAAFGGQAAHQDTVLIGCPRVHVNGITDVGKTC